jgi:hypothetical protein
MREVQDIQNKPNIREGHNLIDWIIGLILN